MIIVFNNNFYYCSCCFEDIYCNCQYNYKYNYCSNVIENIYIYYIILIILINKII